MSKTVPLPSLPAPPPLHADTVIAGPPVLPTQRIKLYSADEWEQFVLEWAHGLQLKYARVERCGGPGDMGRDVIAFPDKSDFGVWDNYQCKHYDHRLQLSDIWIELGKLVYYTYTAEFAYPRAYSFVAPQGAGTALARLLKQPDALREGLVSNWDKYCKKGITAQQEVHLDVRITTYLTGLDFSNIDYVPPLRLIDEHRSTPWHLARFGGSLPARPPSPDPPTTPGPHEVMYLRKLLDAYAEHLKRDVQAPQEVAKEEGIKDHFAESRIQFYSAESLRSFSRDTLPRGAYEELQDEVHDGVRDEIRAVHADGYARVLAVVKCARGLQLTAHALVPRLRIKDRGGICHQLANERDDVRWVKA